MKDNRTQQLVAYLEHIHWYVNEFPEEQIQLLLVKNILKFLEGRRDLQFILGFVDEIVKKQKHMGCFALQEAVQKLSLLSEQLKNKELSITDGETINKMVVDAQLVMTQENL